MENENSIIAAPSAENGNIPVDTPETPPSVPNEPATPAEPTEPVKPTEPELYELPDGRKVDGATLTKEWKENFLPDYTRKSQELAKVKPEVPLQQTTNPLADPNWQPSSYAELIELSKKAALEEIEAKERAKVEAQQAVESTVATQLEEVKKLDPTINENALFLHATKYGFRDLTVAFQNMKDMNELAKNVQKTTAQNIQKRNDPVSGSPGATGARPNPSSFASAQDYLRSLK